MASLASAFPILPGKTEQWKHFSQEMVEPRHSEYEASRKRLGISREAAYLQQTPQGDMAVVYFKICLPDEEEQTCSHQGGIHDQYHQ
jgi:hypothetical protein